MSSDFERLVSSSNPAYKAQQRAEGQGGYPPQPPRRSLDNSNPFLIDDGDDYDDTPVTDSRFRQPPVGSTYPFGGRQQPGAQRDLLGDDPFDPSQTLARATSAGSSSSSSKRGNHFTPAYGAGQPQGWTFDQDDPYPAASAAAAGSSTTVHTTAGGLPFAGSKTFNGAVGSGSTDALGATGAPKKSGGGGLGGIWKRLGQGKFPWQREKVLTGERIVFLNDAKGNGEQGFVSNYVSTTKYNLVMFVPKFLVGKWCN
jgi:phospholipid-transporting ATPase